MPEPITPTPDTGAVTPEPTTPVGPGVADPASVVAAAAKEAVTDDTTLLGTPKKEGTKVDDAPAVTEKVVPERYEFKLPEGIEGMVLDEKMGEAISPVFKKLGLSQNDVNELVAAYAPAIKQQVEASHEQKLTEFKSMIGEWKVETQKFLGADAQPKMAVAAKVLDKFGTPELRELLNETGVGNHKELMSFVIKVGELIKEDSFVDTKPSSLVQTGGMEILYDKSKHNT